MVTVAPGARSPVQVAVWVALSMVTVPEVAARSPLYGGVLERVGEVKGDAGIRIGGLAGVDGGGRCTARPTRD